MRAYSMDLRERALLDSDAGMKAADVAAKYRVSGSWVRLLKQRRRDTGEVAPRVHQCALVCVESTRLHQYGVRHTDLADVVQQAPAPDGFELSGIFAALACEHERIRSHAR